MKPWYKSKTMWTNLATIAGAVVTQLPIVEPFMSPKVYAVSLAVLGVANVGLRAITTEGVTRVSVAKD